jgi:hypothetical protein
LHLFSQYIKNIIIKTFTILIFFFTQKHEKQSIAYNSYDFYLYECTLIQKHNNINKINKKLDLTTTPMILFDITCLS